MPHPIKYDAAIDISVGASRNATNWKPQEVLWSALVERLSKTTTTHEKQAAYEAANVTRQTEIKDVGGFVGGYMTSPNRKKGSVLHRQLITLDIDTPTTDVWAMFTNLYGNAAVLYSTHKHKPEAERLRLVIPLDRPVMSDEYVAISRKIAGVLGIEQFDRTTFQVERLMYWPSTSVDAVFRFEVQDGPWLSADEVLSAYRDWRNTAEWPASVKDTEALQHSIKKQGDPLEKKGIVGTFCRAYTITEVLEKFLAEEYTATDIDNRYTYTQGSTAGGLVLYEDKFTYSHHGTDPTSMMLCNAFDLVRLHKFGLQDSNVHANTPVFNRPSYALMQEFATKDPLVRKLSISERLENAYYAFADIPELAVDCTGELGDVENDDWKELLQVDKSNLALSTIGNVALILDNDPLLKGRFMTDLFRKRKMVVKNLPWRRVNNESNHFTDADAANLRKYVERYGISSSPKITDALEACYAEHSYHPVRDYLNSLVWDRTERLDTLLIDYLGVEDTEYVRAVTRKALTAAVTRIHQPGCKFDTVLTIVGPQGVGKSTLISRLGGEWFSDSFNFHMLQTKEAYEQIQGVWLVEIGELSGLRKADMNAAKLFIAKQEDSYRPAYGQNIVDSKRQCVFFGTTNDRDFLTDPTGDRRFWPVEASVADATKDVFTGLTASEVGQVWAEAVEMYRMAEPLNLSAEMEAQARLKQSEHSYQDDRTDELRKYLDMAVPENWYDLTMWQKREYIKTGAVLDGLPGTMVRNRVCVSEIWVELLEGNLRDMHAGNTRPIHNMLRKLEGWEQHSNKMRFGEYGILRGYLRVAH